MYYSNAEEDKIELQDKPVLKLIRNAETSPKKDYFLYYNSGVFPILMVIIFFLCIGVIINIGLRIQNLNYDKKIYSINKLIDSEKERSDRLNLKISELKSPSRIAGDLFSENAGTNISNQKDSNSNEITAQTNKNITGQTELKNQKSINYINLKNLDIFYSKTANDAVISEQETNSNDNKYYKGVNLITITKNIKDVLMVVSEGILTFFIP
jgi:ABC-type antimicrobial peptide transport system permease subunit